MLTEMLIIPNNESDNVWEVEESFGVEIEVDLKPIDENGNGS
jgi:hypothetical protein